MAVCPTCSSAGPLQSRHQPISRTIAEDPDEAMPPSGGRFTDSEWQDQLARYKSLEEEQLQLREDEGGLEHSEDMVREHKTYMRRVDMIKAMTRKCIRALEFLLT